jgi:hypothetical protein
MFRPGAFLVSPAMVNGRTSFAQRVLGAVDLAIDFATLGEYGLEPLPADGPACERTGDAGWEALAWSAAGSGRPSRRGPCVSGGLTSIAFACGTSPDRNGRADLPAPEGRGPQRRTDNSQIGRTEPQAEKSRPNGRLLLDQAGGMFWLRRKKLCGSYLRFSTFRRSYFAAP